MPATPPPQHKPGALAVLAEIAAIEPLLKRHRQEFAPAFSASVSGMFPVILSELGIKSPLSPQTSQSLATKTVSLSLDNIGKVQATPQLQQLVADAAAQSVIDQEEIARGKTAAQIYEKAQTPASEVVQKNQKGLEEEAVLANLAQIASLQKPDPQTAAIIRDEVQSLVESENPLMPPSQLNQLITSVETYLATSRENLNTELANITLDNLPSLEEFQEIKNKAHEQTISQLGDTQVGNVNLKELASDIGAQQGVKPLDPDQAGRFGLSFAQPSLATFKTRGLGGRRMGLLLASSPRNQERAIWALTAHDSQKLEESRQTPGMREFSFFRKAKDFSLKKPQAAAKYLAHFQQFPGGVNRASQTAWCSIFAYLNHYHGILVPKSVLNDRVLVYASLGALSHKSGNFSLGNSVSGARGLSSGLKSAIGFGKSAKGAVMAGKLAFGASNPLGWAMLAAQFAPAIKKWITRLAMAAAGLGITLLILLGKLLTKLAAMAAGTAVGATIGFLVGGPLGALIGGVIGAGVGYFIVPITQGISQFVSGTSSISGAAGSLISGFFANAASAITGAFSSAAAGALGVLGGFSNLVIGGLGAVAVPSGAVLASVIIAPTAVFVTTVFLSIFTGAAFMSTEAEISAPGGGDNEFFAITKSLADPRLSSLPNPPPDQNVRFNIAVTSKKLRLTNVQIKDEVKVQGKNNSFTRTLQVNNCQGLIEGGASCPQQTALDIDSSFADSVVSNTVTVTATPEGQPPKTDSQTVVVIVGNPPAECPRGWPTRGDVSQGPGGGTDHGSDGYEAIDIGQGTSFDSRPQDVFATFEGKVITSEPRGGDPRDQRIAIQPLNCPGLQIVLFTHLSKRYVKVDDPVRFGQVIGQTGGSLLNSVFQPHLHYQFNNPFDRSFKIEAPYIPASVPRTCNSVEDCRIHIDSAP